MTAFNEADFVEHMQDTLTPEDFMSQSELSHFLMNASDIIEGLLGERGLIPEYRKMYQQRYKEWITKPLEIERDKKIEILLKEELENQY